MKEGGLSRAKRVPTKSRSSLALATLASALASAGEATAETREVDVRPATQQEYKDARGVLQERPGKVFTLPITLRDGTAVDIGQINAPQRRNPDMLEEDAIMPVLTDLGFEDFEQFAEAFNDTFTHRSQEARDLLLDNARHINDRIQRGEDILVTDRTFQNMRLAVGIWVAHAQRTGGVSEIAEEGVDSGQQDEPQGDTQPEGEAPEAYDRARARVMESRDPYGLFSLEVYVPEANDVINVGHLNTQTSGALTEEDAIVPLLRHLGFRSTSDFATAYNARFAHRPDASKVQLEEGAQHTDELLRSGADIRIGDGHFKNLRLALNIYITHDILSQDIGETFSLGGKEFSVADVKRVFPDINVRELLFYPSDADRLAVLVEHLPAEAPRVPERSLTLENVGTVLSHYQKVLPHDEYGNDTETVWNLLGVAEPVSGHTKPTELERVWRESPHARIGQELSSFFHGWNGPYERDARVRDFVHDYDIYDVKRFREVGFTTSAYVYEGG